MTKPTSVRLSAENAEYVDDMSIKLSTWVNEQLDLERATSGMSKREKIQQKLTELETEERTKKQALDRIEQERQALQDQLGNYEANVESHIDEAMAGIGVIATVHPLHRGDKKRMARVMRSTGLGFSTLQDLLADVDIHWSSTGPMDDHNDILSRTDGDVYDHPLYADAEGKGSVGLFEAESKEVRAWLKANL